MSNDVLHSSYGLVVLNEFREHGDDQGMEPLRPVLSGQLTTVGKVGEYEGNGAAAHRVAETDILIKIKNKYDPNNINEGFICKIDFVLFLFCCFQTVPQLGHVLAKGLAAVEPQKDPVGFRVPRETREIAQLALLA